MDDGKNFTTRFYKYFIFRSQFGFRVTATLQLKYEFGVGSNIMHGDSYKRL